MALGRSTIIRGVVALAVSMLAVAPAQARDVPGRTNPYGLSTYPDAPKTCPHLPRGLYARCVAQSDILNAASERARTNGKRVLVVVGADWCVWCVVLTRYMDGWNDPAMEPMAGDAVRQADALARFVARNFVVAELNADSTDIEETLAEAHLTRAELRDLPAAFVVSQGAIQRINLTKAQLPKAASFHGYSRMALLRILRETVVLAERQDGRVATAD